MLKGLVQLQKTGFTWDLMHNGTLHKGVKMTPFVSFLRVDTKEADLFCGKCLNRNKHVAHLCRECHCPTDQSDNHLANHKAKTQSQIATLVLRKDEIRLKAMSQQHILNAYYDIQFGCHNEMGIHTLLRISAKEFVYTPFYSKLNYHAYAIPTAAAN